MDASNKGNMNCSIDSSLVELKSILEMANCKQYYQIFVDNGIDSELFMQLDGEALKELGVNKVGDRIRLNRMISDMKFKRMGNLINVNDIRDLISNTLSNNDSKQDNRNTKDTEPSKEHFKVEKHRDRGYNDMENQAGPKYVTFVLQDGSIKKIDIAGCFNAQSIKRKVLKKIASKAPDQPYDTYVYSTNMTKSESPLSLLYDVELVTICYSPDRLEKNGIIFCPQGEFPSEIAQTISKQLISEHTRIKGNSQLYDDSLDKFRIPEPKKLIADNSMRKFFGQRPPSELISSNLGEYFPETRQRDLEATIRNSVRYSIRLSKKFPSVSSDDTQSSNYAFHRYGKSIGSILSSERDPSNSSLLDARSLYPTKSGLNMRTVGEIMFNNKNAVDTAVNDYASEDKGTLVEPRKTVPDVLSVNSSSSKYIKASFLNPEEKNNRLSRIELLSVDSDDDENGCEDERYFSDGSLDSGINATELNHQWLKGAVIGAGSFGTVFLGMNSVTGELMAVKQVSVNSKSSYSSSDGVTDALEHEMSLLKELNHENIVRYYGASTDENFLNIFLEYVPGGSVQSMLSAYGPFEEPLIRNFIRQTLIGLNYLHGEGIIHRDIKGANILIDIKGTVKISDFGISKRVDDMSAFQENSTQKPVNRRASLQGSVYWMAPEVVKQIAYTKKADIWSVGCLVVEMFTGKHPFPDFSQMQALFKIGTHITPVIPDGCTEEASQFLSKTFELDYKKRPDTVELLSESFINTLIMPKK